MRYELGYDRDSQRLTPATVRARLRMAQGEPLLLREPVEVEVSDPLWQGKIVVSGARLLADRRGAEVQVDVGATLTVDDYRRLVAPRRPVAVRLRLHPASSAPVASEATVDLPPTLPGQIEAEVDAESCPQPGVLVLARVRPLRCLKLTPAEAAAARDSLRFELETSALAITSVESQEDYRQALLRPVTDLTRATLEGGTYPVLLRASLAGQELQLRLLVTLAPPPDYQLHLSAGSLQLDLEHGAKLQAWVTEDGQEVADSRLSLRLDTVVVDASPRSAQGRLETSLHQVRLSAEAEASLVIEASVGKSLFSSPVRLLLEANRKNLEVELDKTWLCPSVPEDVVRLRARLPDEALDFELGPLLASGPPLPEADGWIALELRARDADCPPGMASVTVRGGGLSRTVEVQLMPPPEIEAHPAELSFLVPGKTSRTLELTFSPPGLTGTFHVEPDAAARKLVRLSSIEQRQERAICTVESLDPIAWPKEPVGSEAWHQSGLLTPSATVGGRTLAGRPVRVSVGREGLFIDHIYTLSSRGEYKYDPALRRVPVRVDLPLAHPQRVTKVRFLGQKWNGERLEAEEGVLDVSFGSPQSDDPRSKTVLSLSTLQLELNRAEDADPYSYLNGTWSMGIDRLFPASGEAYPVSLEASAACGKLDVPIDLVTARPETKLESVEVEKERCLKLIHDCLPPDHRAALVEDLDWLPHKGAVDYQTYRQVIWNRAQEIWQQDQRDFLFWDHGWGSTMISACGYARTAGDVAFMVVVGYYARGLGPTAAFAASQLLPIFKDAALEFYAYKVERGGGRDLETIAIEFVNESYVRFLVDLGVTGVDIFLLHGFDPVKNPASLKLLAWLWVWKFVVHWVRDVDERGQPAGLGHAFWAACQEVTFLTGLHFLQQFVNAHGDNKLRDLLKKMKEPAPTAPGPTTGERAPGGRTGGPPAAATNAVGALQQKAPGVEVGVVVRDGKVVHEQVGQSGQELEWGKGESGKTCTQKDRKGAETMHTHPSNGEPGGAHSGTDLANAVKDGQKATHVVGEDKTYTVEVDNEAIDRDHPGDTKRYDLANQIAGLHRELLQVLKARLTELQLKLELAQLEGKPPGEIENLKAELRETILRGKESVVRQVAEKYGKYLRFSTTSR